MTLCGLRLRQSSEAAAARFDLLVISELHFACDRHCKCTSNDLYMSKLPASAAASV